MRAPALALLLVAGCEPVGLVRESDADTVPPGYALLIAEGLPIAQVRLLAAGFSSDEARQMAERCEITSSFNVQRELAYRWDANCEESQ